VRSRLDAVAFAAAWKLGKALTVDDAIALAYAT